MKFKFRLIPLIAMLAFSWSIQAQDEAVEAPANSIPTEQGDLVIHPVSHASFVMEWNNLAVYVDPVGGVAAYDGLPRPNLILITDIHGDHLDSATLTGLAGTALLVAPQAVWEQLPASLQSQTLIVHNEAETERLGVKIKAIPMYNLTEDRLQYHDKGRGNGYVLTMGGTRVYVSGDTEDIPEMRALENIDVAFVCFNLPYTMTESQAADAVNEFKPGIVYPYHFRGSDLALFTSLIEDGIEVRNGDWY